MSGSAVGRNDPCPCGSGKKYKHCCLEKDEFFARKTNGNTPAGIVGAGSGQAGNSGDTSDAQGYAAYDDPITQLRAALEGREFESEAELSAFAESLFSGLNSTGAGDFHGLSPDQMHRLLYAPFDSPEIVTFPSVLDSASEAPVMKLVNLIVEAVGEGGLKATEKGNLPRAFCRNAARIYQGDSPPRFSIPPDRIQRETDFPDIERAHFAMLDAGLLRKTKGKFHLTQKYRKALKQSGFSGIYPLLLRSFARSVNWGYWDRLPEYSIVQNSFLFSLHVLQQDGRSSRPQEHYEDLFLKAFPNALELEAARFWIEPEKELRLCYTVSILERFAAFFGLIRLQQTNMDFFLPQYEVTAQPLLYEAVQFHV
jgi:hypothetical protein